MVYQWKIPIHNIPAQAAGEELERISTNRGKLTPEAVVDESRDESAVLHPCFEWDDATAAERFRQHQAGNIIRNIVTVKVDNEPVNEPVRAFVSVQSEYKPINVVVKSVEYKSEMLANALRELQAFQNKYSTLQELSGLFGVINDLLKGA